jgi:hypothetical protein
VGNGEDGLGGELLADGFLEQLISFKIDIRCSFIKEEDLTLFQQNSCQAYQLLLPN